jgi:hypothetical protein
LLLRKTRRVAGSFLQRGTDDQRNKVRDPEAVVIKYNDGGTTATSGVEALSRVPIKLPQGMQDQAAILIE